MLSAKSNLFGLDNTTGAITSLRRGDKEFALAGGTPDLFMLRFRNATNKPVFAVSSRAASSADSSGMDSVKILLILVIFAFLIIFDEGSNQTRYETNR